MPTLIDTAICIRHWDFSETSQTVSLFTRDHGVIRGLAKGSRRAKGAFSGGIDVLTRGQVMAIVKSGRELATITAWHLQELYRHVRERLPANRAALYMADLVHHMVIDHDPHPRLFDALEAGLQALAEPAAVDVALLRFQWALLVECGYRPELRRDARTGRELHSKDQPLYFDPRAGGVVTQSAEDEKSAGVSPGLSAPTPAPPGAPIAWRVRLETIELLRALDQDASSWSTPASPLSIQRANRLLAAYARELLGREVPTLRWAFSDSTT